MKKINTLLIITSLCVGWHTGLLAHSSEKQDIDEIQAMFSSERVAVDTTECVLSQGTKTTCAKVTVTVNGADHSMGPWCPRTIADGKEKTGIWIDNGTGYDADGAFIKNLPVLYKDARWQMFDQKSGKVNVTDSRPVSFSLVGSFTVSPLSIKELPY